MVQKVRASLTARLVKNLPAMQETQVQFLGQEDSLEKGMANHSSILAWICPLPTGCEIYGHPWRMAGFSSGVYGEASGSLQPPEVPTKCHRTCLPLGEGESSRGLGEPTCLQMWTKAHWRPRLKRWCHPLRPLLHGETRAPLAPASSAVGRGDDMMAPLGNAIAWDCGRLWASWAQHPTVTQPSKATETAHFTFSSPK